MALQLVDLPPQVYEVKHVVCLVELDLVFLRDDGEFIIQACHDRKVEVYNERLDRWEEELLDDLTATVPLPLKLRVAFGRQTRPLFRSRWPIYPLGGHPCCLCHRRHARICCTAPVS